MKKLRKERHRRIRKKIIGTDARPRLCVFRSSKHIYAQIVNDGKAGILASVSTLSKEFKGMKVKPSTQEAAYAVGKLIAEKAKKAGISKISFDRGGYKYHGKVKKLSEGAREGGLEF
ncbi:50S ribosomal protein L18 [Candidatus Omnitrophota bacterium]